MLRTLLVLFLATMSLFGQKKAVVPAGSAANPNFSPGILVDGTLYVSGQIGRDAKTGQVPEDFGQELKSCLDSIGAVLKAGGMTFKDVVSVTVYLSDMALFAQMDGIYVTYFPDPKPARATVAISKLALPNARVEISVIAHK